MIRWIIILIALILIVMKTKLKIGFNETNQLIISPNQQMQRQGSSCKYKILPYLKSINHEFQPIDYKIYEKIRKNKRIQVLHSNNNSQLFLQGEVAAYTASRQKKICNNQSNLMHLLTVNKKEKIINKRIYKIAPQRQSHTESERHEPSQEQSKSNIKPNKTFLPKKIPSICAATTQSPHKSESSRNQNNNSNVKSNWSIQVKSSNDLQKPIVYLQKKQLAQIKAQSFIVMEYPSLQVITGNRFKNSAEIASLTKIMTFYTVYQISIEKQIELSEHLITIDQAACEMTGTTAQLVPGDLISIEQLLYGLMLPSGNDAAIALANWAGALSNTDPQETSALSSFTLSMNKYAKALQMRQSFFGNPHGLPNYRNSSNPYDLSLLIAQCIQIPLFCRIVSTTSYNIWITNQGVKKEVIWENTNKLLRRNGFIGVKTGVTVTAGPCLATCYENGDKKFIIVLLRTSKLSRRFKQTRLILGWTLRRYNHQRYHTVCKQILKHDAILDSDNSQDEQQFHYQKMDADELAKRNKILVYQL